MIVAVAIGTAAPALAWRSPLYPTTWKPATPDSMGRFLHDFSYAGYHGGAKPIPTTPPGKTYDVTKAPYAADATGAADVTAAIQKAIDDAGSAGGGIVFLPAGTYRIAPPPGKQHALHINKSGVVLRGAGPDKTFLYNAETVMRDKFVILVSHRPEYYVWFWDNTDVTTITADLPLPTRTIPVASTAAIKTGDWVLLRIDPTDAFIAEHGMTGVWTKDDISGPAFYRQVTGVDAAAKTITVDGPTRYAMKTRDNARVVKLPAHVEEDGIEDLSIGMKQNDTPGMGTDDYDVPGTGGYEVAASFFVYWNHAVNGWMRNVKSYKPAGNTKDVHFLSNAIRMDNARWITIDGLDLRNAQYQGAGGNGYLYVLTGNDCLVTRSHGQGARHHFTFSMMTASGNVVHRSSSKSPKLPVDFHQRLSMANLIDNLSLDDDNIEAIHRDCCLHGHATTESVIWNAEGISYPSDQYFTKFIVDTQQYGWGYVIGTRGKATNVRTQTGEGTEPDDWVEGMAMGDTLEPASLYEDQVMRRLGFTPGADGGASDGKGADDGAASDAGDGSTEAGGGEGASSDAGGRDGASGGDGGASTDSAGGCGCFVGQGDQGGASFATLATLLLGLVSRRARRSVRARKSDVESR